MSKQLHCRHYHSELEHPNCFRHDIETSDTFPAVLVFDIETLPILAYVWGAWENNLNIDSVVKDWCILAWSAKWLHDDKIISDVLTSKETISRDDKRLMKNAWKLLDAADIVISHNGRQFDLKKIDTRFMFHGMPPPSSYKNIDTLVAARSVFGMTMNKQDYIAKYLGIQRKLETNFQLWVDCDSGNKNSLKIMQNYNIQDILMLENIYLRIREWIPNHPNLANMAQVDGCPVCMSANYKKIGIYYAAKNRYIEWRCQCGAIFHAAKPLK